jgi:hypothetical protein
MTWAGCGGDATRKWRGPGHHRAPFSLPPQVSLLQNLLTGLPGPGTPADGGEDRAAGGVGGEQGGGVGGGEGVEVLTIDRYQGRDKAVILLSLVRSNPHGAAGQLLADWQRLNVAITRARVKLLILGSAATLGGVPLLARLVSMADAGGWRVRLPPEALAAGGAGAGAVAAPAAQR